MPAETVAWLAADASVRELLGELRMAGGRISEIVGAVKGYAYLDQAPVQRVDVRIGLEQTLVILRHRLREGVNVVWELEADLPEIEAFGSELNQVWTNLIDNATDAMDGRGTLTIRAEADPDADGVRVSICDTGPGVPDDVRAKLFEPFFTTKPPGVGTGLGRGRAIGLPEHHHVPSVRPGIGWPPAVPDGKYAIPDGLRAKPNGLQSVPDGSKPVPDGGKPIPDGSKPIPDGGDPLPDGHGGRRHPVRAGEPGGVA